MQKAKLIVLFAVIVSINTCVIGGITMPFHSLSAGVPGPPGPAGPGTFTEETSIVSVRDYGATGDGVTGDRDAIYNAIAAANDRELLFPAGTYRVESDLIFGSTVAVRFLNGARLSIDSGATATINGPLEAGLYQIFSGDGSIRIGKGAVPMVYPQWWGAVGDDNTDNSDAFNKALELVKNVGVLYIPTGIYRLNAPINAFPSDYATYQNTGIVIRGAGMKDTILKYMASSGYCVELKADELSYKAPCYVTLEDIHIMAPNIGSSGGGGVLFASTLHCHLERVALSEINNSYGVAIHARRRNYKLTEDSYTHDADRDFTSSGVGSSARYAIKFTTPSIASCIKEVSVRLGRTGSPAGTIAAYIYDDDSGEPGLQLGGSSDPVSCNSLTADPNGADVTFTFALFDDMPPVLESTEYWLVLATDGYAYEDGVTEVRLRVDAADGEPDRFATYDAGNDTWSTSNDGSNNTLLIRYGQCIMNKLREVYVWGSTRAYLGLKMEEDSQFHISDSNFVVVNGLEAEGDPLIFCTRTQFSTSGGRTVNVSGGETSWSQCYLEGGDTSFPAYFNSGKRHTLSDSELGVYMTWGIGTPIEIRNCHGPLFYTDDATIQHERFSYKIYGAESQFFVIGYTTTLVSDPAALNGKCIQLNAKYDYAYIAWTYSYPGQYTYLPRGTYMATVYAKDTNQLADDMRLYVYQSSQSTDLAETRFTLTNSYKPYRIMFHIGSSNIAKTIFFYIQRSSTGTNVISLSHVVFEYLGTDIVFNSDTISYNPEPSNADGGRETRKLFIGRQLGGEQSALATITAFHDGPGDDQKGKLEFGVNDGNDSFSPTTRLTLDSTGRVDISGRLCMSTINDFSDGDTTPSVSAGNIFRTGNTGSTTITAFDNGLAGQVITVIIEDNNTKVDFTGTNLRGNNGSDWIPASGDHMTCVFDGNKWYCTINNNTQ